MPATAQISGRLGFDPELRFTHGGTPVVNLSVANNRSVKNGDEREFVADWYKVTLFGRDAEVIAEHARKGSALAFNGRLQMERYDDREGNARSTVVLVANSFEFMPGPKREENAAGTVKASKRTVAPDGEANGELSEDDIPF